MLPPEEYARMAREAAGIVQIEIATVSLAKGETLVSGPVVRLFRGPAAWKGSTISLRVPCIGTGADDDDDFAPGDPGRIPASELRMGRVLEAYVDHSPAGFEIVLDLYAVIDSPTENPRQNF
jgi:hypothetical protein